MTPRFRSHLARIVSMTILFLTVFHCNSADLDKALLKAVIDGNPERVQLLLKSGADPNVQRQEGAYPALLLAVELGELEIVKMLVEAGADVNYEDPSTFVTAATFATSSGRSDILEYLLENHAAKDCFACSGYVELAVSSGNSECVEIFISRGFPVSERSLFVAVRKNHLGLVALLLDEGLDVNAIDKLVGVTPLILAVVTMRNEKL